MLELLGLAILVFHQGGVLCCRLSLIGVVCGARVIGGRYTATMRFEWDGQKNRTNIRKHGLDFVDARVWIAMG